MIDGFRTAADGGSALAREVMLPLVQGIGAFAQGEYREAARLLGPLQGELTRIGGSHAQREVFEDTILEACLRAEDLDMAEELLRSRLEQRPSVRDSFSIPNPPAVCS